MKKLKPNLSNIRNFILKTLNIIATNFKYISIILILVLVIIVFRQCESASNAKDENLRLLNNNKALTIATKHFLNENNNIEAEKRALVLTVKEVRDSLKFEKTKPPVTITKWNTKIVEVIKEVPVIKVDTTGNFTSILSITKENKYKHSSRLLEVSVPFSVKDTIAVFGESTVNLVQNIWVQAVVSQDTKTKEAWVNLETDYPGVTFNNLQSILVDTKADEWNKLTYKNRKTMGITFVAGGGFTMHGIGPFVGIGIGYTPRFLQW